MSRTRKKHFPCGHSGFGGHCHRCEFAEKLETMAAAKTPYVDHKKTRNHKKPHTWTLKAMLAEAVRLRKAQARKKSNIDSWSDTK